MIVSRVSFSRLENRFTIKVSHYQSLNVVSHAVSYGNARSFRTRRGCGMANSIPFDEWTPIPNSIVDALAFNETFPTETRVLWCLLRAVLGWEKSRLSNSAAIGIPTIMTRTKVSRKSVNNAIRSLERKQLISVDRKGQRIGKANMYSLNFDLLQQEGPDLVQLRRSIYTQRPSAIKAKKPSAIGEQNKNPDLVQSPCLESSYPSANAMSENAYPSAKPTPEKTNIKKRTKETIKEKYTPPSETSFIDKSVSTTPPLMESLTVKQEDSSTSKGKDTTIKGRIDTPLTGNRASGG